MYVDPNGKKIDLMDLWYNFPIIYSYTSWANWNETENDMLWRKLHVRRWYRGKSEDGFNEVVK